MSGWIDVNDRLPERLGLEEDETEYVLVAERASDCTHWMPFPEPPEGRLEMEME